MVSVTDPPAPRRRFTLAEARRALPEIRRLTAKAHDEFTAVQRALAGPTDEATCRRLEIRLNQVAREWAKAIEARGAEAKGLWLVDFDNGAGYYCWRYPERDVEHFHGYEEGFRGRMRIN